MREDPTALSTLRAGALFILLVVYAPLWLIGELMSWGGRKIHGVLFSDGGP